MYFTTGKLLRYHPRDALLIMINQGRFTLLQPETTHIRSVNSLGGVRTEVIIDSVVAPESMIDDYHIGTARFEYSRLDLGVVLAGTSVNRSVPTTTHDVIRELSYKTGILFDLNEIVLEVVRSNVATIRAAPHSLRWVGEVDIDITTDPDLPLSTILYNYVLRDLRYPECDKPIEGPHLSTVLTDTVLSDLRYPECDKPIDEPHLSTTLTTNVLSDLKYPICEIPPHGNHLSLILTNTILSDLKYPR